MADSFESLVKSLKKDMLPKKKPELICPAGTWASLNEVLPFADAVYFGATDSLNMRTRANNFEYSEIQKVVEKCKEKNVRTYFTLNTIIYDDELVELHQAIELVKEYGVDAVICHDQASIQICRHLDMPFHVSTQANITNKLSAKFYEALGAKMIILSRELSIGQVSEITKSLETAKAEVFVHGAMCAMFSGRCFFSAEEMGFKREFAANKGACVQPCRRMFWILDEEGNKIETDGNMFFNSKDLCMIDHMDLLVASGIGGLKIEGRIRDPTYCGVVSRVYREAIDSVFESDYTDQKILEWKRQLDQIFNRGFHTGFYFDTPTLNEQNRRIRGNVSDKHRQLLGYVENYYPKVKAAVIKAVSGALKIDDEVLIEGPEKSEGATYFTQIVKSIQIDGENINETPYASSENHVHLGILMEKPVKRNDKVFIFIRNSEQ